MYLFVSRFTVADFASFRWQDNQQQLQDNFQFIFTELSILGQSNTDMIDCSDVIPASEPADFGPAVLPAGKTMDDIEQAVRFALSYI